METRIPDKTPRITAVSDSERLEELMRDPAKNLMEIAELLGQFEPEPPLKVPDKGTDS
jgi:hypothetical protein